MTDIVRYRPQELGPLEARAWGELLAVEGQATPEEQAAKLIIGGQYGMSVHQSLDEIYLMKDRHARVSYKLAAKRLAAWIKASDDMDYEVIENQDFAASARLATVEQARQEGITDRTELERRVGALGTEVAFYRRGKRTGVWAEVGRVRYTVADAQRDGVLDVNAWKENTQHMAFYRCITLGVPLYFPDVVDQHLARLGRGGEPRQLTFVDEDGVIQTVPPVSLVPDEESEILNV